jgi:hypothetical protein
MPVRMSQIDHRIYPTTTMVAAGSNPAGSRVPTSMQAADTIPKRPSHVLNGSGDPNMARVTNTVQRLVKR